MTVNFFWLLAEAVFMWEKNAWNTAETIIDGDGNEPPPTFILSFLNVSRQLDDYFSIFIFSVFHNFTYFSFACLKTSRSLLVDYRPISISPTVSHLPPTVLHLFPTVSHLSLLQFHICLSYSFTCISYSFPSISYSFTSISPTVSHLSLLVSTHF